MHEKLIALQHQVVVDLVDKIRPDLGRQQRFEQGNAKSDSRGKPVRRDQQSHNPAGLIQKPAAEKPDARDLIPKLCPCKKTNEACQKTNQKNVDDSLKQGGQHHDSKKAHAPGRQFLEQELQFIPGLALDGHEQID